MQRSTFFRYFKIFFSIAISVALIWWIVLNVDVPEVLKVLKSVKLPILFLVFILTIIQSIIRAVRWRFLLPDQKDVGKLPLSLLFDSLMLGNFGNFVLPLRAGEFIRPLMLTKYSKVRYPISLTSVVTERFFDLSMVLILFAVMVASLGELPAGMVDGVGKSFADIRHGLSVGACLLSGVAAALFAFIVMGSLCPKFLLKIISKTLFIFPQRVKEVLLKLVADFLTGTEVLRKPHNLFMVLILSAGIWILTVYTYQLTFFAFEGMVGSFWAALVLTTVLALGVAAPSAPGFLGVFEVACIIAFAIVGENKELATSYAIVSHLLQYIIVVGFGVIVLIKYGIKLNDLK